MNLNPLGTKEETKMNRGLISGLVLLVIGIICGLMLALVNYFTAGRITEEENKIKYAVLEEFYTLSEYEISETQGEGSFSTIYFLKEKGTDNVEAVIYTVSAKGYSSTTDVEMLIAINSDMSVEGYKVTTHQESSGFGADIVDNNFGVDEIDDLSNFQAVSGVTVTSNAIKTCFTLVSQRVISDLGGGSGE